MSKPIIWYSRGQNVWVATTFELGIRNHHWCKTFKAALKAVEYYYRIAQYQ